MYNHIADLLLTNATVLPVNYTSNRGVKYIILPPPRPSPCHQLPHLEFCSGAPCLLLLPCRVYQASFRWTLLVSCLPSHVQCTARTAFLIVPFCHPSLFTEYFCRSWSLTPLPFVLVDRQDHRDGALIHNQKKERHQPPHRDQSPLASRTKQQQQQNRWRQRRWCHLNRRHSRHWWCGTADVGSPQLCHGLRFLPNGGR